MKLLDSFQPASDFAVHDPTSDVRKACGIIAAGSGPFKPVVDVLRRLFIGNRLGDYPHLFRPEDAEPFNWAHSIELPDQGTGDTTVLTFKVPTGFNGVILHVSNQITTGFLEGGGDVVWRLKQGGRPVKNFGNIVTTLGSLATPYPVYGIRLVADSVMEYTVSNVGILGAGIMAIAVVGGYYWPQGRKR